MWPSRADSTVPIGMSAGPTDTPRTIAPTRAANATRSGRRSEARGNVTVGGPTGGSGTGPGLGGGWGSGSAGAGGEAAAGSPEAAAGGTPEGFPDGSVVLIG